MQSMPTPDTPERVKLAAQLLDGDAAAGAASLDGLGRAERTRVLAVLAARAAHSNRLWALTQLLKAWAGNPAGPSGPGVDYRALQAHLMRVCAHNINPPAADQTAAMLRAVEDPLAAHAAQRLLESHPRHVAPDGVLLAAQLTALGQLAGQLPQDAREIAHRLLDDPSGLDARQVLAAAGAL